MIWLCPYTELRPETRAALTAHVPGHRLRFAPLDPSDDFGYGRLIASLWLSLVDFVVVEHDIVIRQDVVDAFEDCPETYCAFPYPWTTNVGPALGCTRFRRRLLHDLPHAAQDATSVGYRQYDYHLIRVELGRKYGRAPHLHLPPVEHLNPEQALRDEFAGMSIADHLGALGYRIDEGGVTARYEPTFGTDIFGWPQT